MRPRIITLLFQPDKSAVTLNSQALKKALCERFPDLPEPIAVTLDVAGPDAVDTGPVREWTYLIGAVNQGLYVTLTMVNPDYCNIL